jgi:hypothetical protein
MKQKANRQHTDKIFLTFIKYSECRNLPFLLYDQPSTVSQKSSPPNEDQWYNNELPGQGYFTLQEGSDS